MSDRPNFAECRDEHPADRWARWSGGIVSVSGESITVDRQELGHLVEERDLLLAACEALPTFSTDDADAADYKDHASGFADAMRLARVALAKATESRSPADAS